MSNSRSGSGADLKLLPPPEVGKWRAYERMALQIRDFAKLSLTARLDPFALAESINVRVLYPRDLAGLSGASLARLDVVDGWSGGATQALEDGSHIVILNQRHSMERQAATLMEEVCHVLFGHKPSEIGAEQNGGRSYNFSVEDEAYSVGAAALVPYHALKTLLISGDSIRKIARRFGVTPSLIVYRIKGTGLGKFLP
ncbi:MAG: ImmA/IrrE family metallo-endopeptidase [Chloracidobacterium sp.]|nr:ImmA/IrrE family metallo-endopeptidase [Chloracidobacterium sp.]